MRVLVDGSDDALRVELMFRLKLLELIDVSQANEEELKSWFNLVKQGLQDRYELRGDGIVTFKGRLCISRDKDIRDEILPKAHHLQLSIYPDSTKMYHNLKPFFWWPGIKREVAEFV